MDVWKLKSGDLRDVVKFEKNDPNPAESGGEFDSYTEFLTARGYLKKTSGSRNLEVSEIILNSDYELAVYFQNALNNELNGGAQGLRLIINNRFFTVSSFDNIENKNTWFYFKLTEMQRG